MASRETGDNFNRYAYANNNPYKFKDPDGRIIETPWDVANVALDVVSIGANVAAGNYGSAAVDVAGLVYDAVATAVPGLPAGAGVALKAVRAADKVRDVVKAADKVGDAKKAAQGPRYATGKLREQVMDKGRQADGSVKCTYCGKPTATASDHVVPHSTDCLINNAIFSAKKGAGQIA